jgi:hypothetical protein
LARPAGKGAAATPLNPMYAKLANATLAFLERQGLQLLTDAPEPAQPFFPLRADDDPQHDFLVLNQRPDLTADAPPPYPARN